MGADGTIGEIGVNVKGISVTGVAKGVCVSGRGVTIGRVVVIWTSVCGGAHPAKANVKPTIKEGRMYFMVLLLHQIAK